jgi:hypothetical protein
MQALSYLGSVVVDLVCAVAILYSFTLLGHSVRLVLPTVDWSPSVNVLWDLYIGVTSAAILTTVLGMLGFFNPLIFASILAAGPLLHLRHTDAFIMPWRALRDSVASCRGQLSMGFVLIASVAIVVVPTAVPEIFYDALYYHLGLPLQYAMAGQIQWLPHVVHSAFPAYLDVLFGLCLGLGGPGVAKFFNLLLFIIGWGATVAFVYEVLGDTRAAVVGAVTVSTIPGVVVMSTMCAIDAALIGFAAMSALALARMQRSGATNLKPLILLAALSAGFVAGSKYTGLWLVGVLALSLLVNQRPLAAIRPAVFFISMAILVASPWYVRNVIFIGDPIYPVLSGVLGNSDARWAIERLQRDVPGSGLSWTSLTNLIVGLVENRDFFGAGAQPGLLIPLGVVALLLGALRVSFLRPWAVAVTLYFVVWLSQANVVRYIYPIFPLCGLGVAWAVSRAFERVRYPAFVTAVLVMLAIAPLSQSIRTLDALYVGSEVAALASGTLSKDEYLSRRLAYYPAVQWLNAHVPPQAHVLYLGETRLLYLDRPVKFSSAYDRTEIAHLLGPEAPPLFSQLRSLGVTHIVIHGREIERLRAAYEYLPLSVEAEQRLRAALGSCRILFHKHGVQICELPRET